MDEEQMRTRRSGEGLARSMPCYVATLKRDLEARGEVERTPVPPAADGAPAAHVGTPASGPPHGGPH